MKFTVYIFLAFLIIAGCGNDDSESPLTLPSNLQITVEVSDDGSGQVDVTATAVNANFYKIFFGESSSETPVKSNDGTASHTYAESGDYTITVQAHATEAAFIDDTDEITIILKADGGIVIPTEGYTTPLTYSGMELVFQDEFDGTSIDETKWSFETGAGGWGNEELEYYRKDNAAIQSGNLIITAKKESFLGSDYTSTRMNTHVKKDFTYGRVDFRAALPQGQGIWPALWMLGSNFSTVGWPKCGEIDVMEMIGGAGREKTVHGTAHWDNAGSYASYGQSYSLASGTFNDKFHVFSIVWDETKITWYMDDVQFNVIDITPANLSEFKNSFFVIINLAVGGKWPGNPDGTTVFPQHLIVDYVRVFQKN